MKTKPSDKQTVLITGGAGFIGTNIAKSLLAQGHDVESIDIFTTSDNTGLDWPNHEVNIQNLEHTKRVIKHIDPDILIHAAAQTQVQTSVENPVEDAHTNILGTINVLEGLQHTKARKVIYLTTGGARYGEKDALPISEDALPKPKAPYGISKYAAEHYTRYYARKNGWQHTSLGFSNVYGPHDNPKSGRLIPVFITTYLQGNAPTIYGDGEQTRDFLYVQDIIQIIKSIIKQDPPREFYNLSSNEQTSVNQIVDILEELTAPKKTAVKGDARSGGVRKSQLDNTHAVNDFEFKPTPVEKGLEQTVKWFKENT